MTELIYYVLLSVILVAIGIYGLVVKRNAVRMLFALEIIANAANLNLIAFSRNLSNAQGQVFALFSIAIAAAEVAVGLGIIAVSWFSFGILAISTALLFVPAATLHGGQSAYVESYPWSQFGNFGLRLDGLSLPFAMIIYILCTVLALYSKPYMINKIMEDVHGHIGSAGSTGSTGSSGPSGQATSIVDRSQQQHVQNQMALYFALYMTFSMGMLGTVLATNLIEFFVFFELMLVPSFFLVAFYG